MYCPKCRTEYLEDVKECVDCHVLLVDDLPEETPLEKIKWVALPVLPGKVYADMVEEVLSNMDIPHFTKSDWATSAYNISSSNLVGTKITIFVPEDYHDEATQILNEILGKK